MPVLGTKIIYVPDSSSELLRIRIGKDGVLESLPFGKSQKIRDVQVSFHPAGHILGSAQIRIELKGRVWVVSGDYKPQPDITSEPFELIKCHGFISGMYFWSAGL